MALNHGALVEAQHAFTEHLRAFVAGLPPEEQVLAGQLVALAAAALDVAEDEVQGYLSLAYDPLYFAGLFTSVAFPALDAGSKDPRQISLTGTPAAARVP
jgi:hypothetical protein